MKIIKKNKNNKCDEIHKITFDIITGGLFCFDFLKMDCLTPGNPSFIYI